MGVFKRTCLCVCVCSRHTSFEMVCRCGIAYREVLCLFLSIAGRHLTEILCLSVILNALFKSRVFVCVCVFTTIHFKEVSAHLGCLAHDNAHTHTHTDVCMCVCGSLESALKYHRTLLYVLVEKNVLH